MVQLLLLPHHIADDLLTLNRHVVSHILLLLPWHAADDLLPLYRHVVDHCSLFLKVQSCQIFTVPLSLERECDREAKLAGRGSIMSLGGLMNKDNSSIMYWFLRTMQPVRFWGVQFNASM